MTELTEEQLAQMSPEQVAEMQKQQCIFCHIISGKVASKKIYEDEKCLAILDINPANPGHVLILPKEHYSIMPLMPEEEIAYLFRIAKKVSKAQIRGLKADGTNIFAANGAVAGQKAPHFMIHVIPRKENDGITVFNLPKNQINAEDQAKIRQAVKGKVNEQLGIKEEEPVDVEKAEPEKVETTVEEAEQEEGTDPTGPMFHVPPPDEKSNEEVEPEEDRSKLDEISNLFK
ncbi:HIT domain-containing protein [Candidatus Woesearchaeota archaeon]|nr:HIT domain-containing protein [Candidatus Woesearchaeota archaeon]